MKKIAPVITALGAVSAVAVVFLYAPALTAQPTSCMPLAPMLLLPLIDNAVRHGLEPLPRGGRIDLRARVERGRLSLAVADTGIGDPEALAEGAGLASLRERLVGLHGNAAQLTISRTNPHGMTIAIEVPHASLRWGIR